MNFNGYAANGPFQLLNPLARLADGELLGRDFHFFHGAGVALVHFPLYVLFNEGLFGSEMSRYFTSIIFFVASGLLLFYSWFRREKNNKLLVLGSFSIACLLTYYFAEAITPSNSLLGVRSTMPLFIAALILSKDRITYSWASWGGKIKVRLYDVLLAITIASAVLLGTEHGIASIIGYILMTLLLSLKNNEEQPTHVSRLIKTIQDAFFALLPVGVFTIVLLLTIATIISSGHPLELFTYSLITVPGDQFWYFGTDPQGYLSFDTVLMQLADQSMYPLYLWFALTTASFYSAYRFKLFTRNQWTAILFLLFYGLFTLSSFLGYFTPSGQIVGCIRVLILINAVVLVQGALRLRAGKYARVPRGVMATIALLPSLALIAVSISILNTIDVRHLTKSTYQNLQGNHAFLLGGAWSERVHNFQPFIDSAKKESDTPLWSTYSSLHERGNDLFHPSSGGYDYIIHALGDERDVYTQDFINKKPVLVSTLRQSYFGFEEWLWGRHADFYKHLVQNYEIVAENDSHTLWRRSSFNGPKGGTTSLQTTAGSQSLSLPNSLDATSRLIEVEVQYNVSAPLHLERIPRYLVRPQNTTSKINFSLPPSKDTWKFLVVLNENNNDASLEYLTRGLLPGANLNIVNAKYTPIAIDEKELRFFTEESVFLKPTPQ